MPSATKSTESGEFVFAGSAEKEERLAHAVKELREHGITVADDMIADARTGSSFARLAALRSHDEDAA